MKSISLDNITSWSDFKSYVESMPNTKSMGNAFEQLTKLYFQINPLYRSKYEEVWLLDEVPSKDLEYLDLPRQDLGIDLIAKSGDEYHAIQCKYHSDKTNTVKNSEVSTFTSILANKKNLSHGYICSTALNTSRNFNKLEIENISNVLYDTWSSLDKDFFDKARQKINKKIPKEKPFTPKPHQRKAIRLAHKHFVEEKNNRGKLIFPCGSGKSLTGFWMMEKLDATSTLVAVPSLSLVKQTLEVYLKQVVAKKMEVKWLCICSDEGIGKGDDVVTYTRDLPVPCTTDSDYIKNWLKENKKENIIIFTTYQSGRLIAEASKSLKFTFDLGIYDEAHKTVGKNENLFSYLLFEENISVKHRIFMTATERFYRGVRDDVLTMDDPEDYGEVFCHMSFKEAIEQDLLTDYKIITIEVKKEEIAAFIKDNNLVKSNAKWGKENEARSLASMIALRKAMKTLPIKNAVSFHSSIERATRNKEVQKHITETYNYNPIDTYHVSGKLPTTKRNDVVQEFAKSDRALITNSRCLTEGVDVPNIDCIVFADPRKSKVDIVQALGRALRKKDGKDFGYVVLPVIYDHKSHVIDNDNFQEILNVVRGLAANDERVIDEFKDKNKNSKGFGYGGDDIFKIDPELINESDLIDNLNIKLWENLSRFQWLTYREAEKFAKSLNLSSRNEWAEYNKTDNRHKLIPVNPDRYYKSNGWKSWGVFLGTGIIAPGKIKYREFKAARKFARSLGLKNVSEWVEYCKTDSSKPLDIPQNPINQYRNNGWIGYGDWLGTGNIHYNKRELIDFNELKKIAQGLKLSSRKKWEEYYKKNKAKLSSDTPKYPDKAYENRGWVSWGDFLGTGYVATNKREYLVFEKAREYARGLNLNSISQWDKLHSEGKIRKDIPRYPQKNYADKGWKGYEDFLDYVSEKQEWMTYNEARNYIKKYNFKSYLECVNYFRNNSNKPKKFPLHPRGAYKNKGWRSANHFLGIPEKNPYLDFHQAKKEVRKMEIAGWKDWKERHKKNLIPTNIPKNPYTVYKTKGWTSVDDFFGKPISANNKAKQGWVDFKTAKKYALKLNLKSGKEWKEYIRLNKDLEINLPATAERVYSKKGWKSWGDFLGYEDKYREIVSLDMAKEILKEINIKDINHWRSYTKSSSFDERLPRDPHTYYKGKGWKGFRDFIGKED
jgi:superfamily II DNA or RNA helicase